MENFINTNDYDATIHREILDALLRADAPSYDPQIRRTRQTLWSAVQMLTQKLCCQTIHDCPKVVPLHYESE